jgi:hypothetical protein
MNLSTLPRDLAIHRISGLAISLCTFVSFVVSAFLRDLCLLSATSAIQGFEQKKPASLEAGRQA